MKQTGRGCATSELAIDIKRTFDNVHKGVLLKTMSDLDLPEASRCCMNYFMSRRGNSLIIDSEVKKTETCRFGYSIQFVYLTASVFDLYEFSVQ